MRLLNAKENTPELNLENAGCNYTQRFTDKEMKPFGFSSMEDGTGDYDMLVIGNSYACNQGEVVYNAFKKHARKFNVFCLEDCEVLVTTIAKICKHPPNYTAIVEELQPDVVFLMSRAISAKFPFESAIDDDWVFRDHMKAVTEIESIAKKEGLIIRDDHFARLRIGEVAKRCQKCELIDYYPLLVGPSGHYQGYNSFNNLMYLDDNNHFNRFGKERIQVVFDRLSEKFNISVPSPQYLSQCNANFSSSLP
ncbi:hypothetical protein Y032_0240g3356 [Ancylostoma ceylanicum]|uniref:SGNH domain-containing protein n=1 Tax=Ancylostoma ceylanicum TaxID=53326 RepID=A0A016SE12_9BILA|nr:hypothetical protein Y032_0240g3356 [Ancylostoma ceylanicum]